MRRIGIDCRFASGSSGLGRYTRELVTELLRRKDDVEYVLFVTSEEQPWLPVDASTHYSLRTTNSRHYSLSEQLVFPLQIFRAHLDLFFAPHFNVPFFCPVPFVATIHDLILHRYPNNASWIKQHAYRLVMRSTVRRARKLVAVSGFTAQEIADAYGQEALEKTEIVPEAVSSYFRRPADDVMESVLKRYAISRPYFLYVGNCKQHKNVSSLLAAYRKLPASGRSIVLITGGPECEALPQTPGVKIVSGVPDAFLPVFYAAADFFVTPSLYEGFCLPILEAAACGCPVIATNVSAIPEVAPAGCMLIEPTEEALTAALKNPPRTPPAVPQRTWADVAEETSEVLGMRS